MTNANDEHKKQRANALARETSPYLLQHAHNPVDWYPWGSEALERARREDKPIFLSIGYAACHWCHVMAHESFEDEETARFMNEHFVNIKVDREERPDLDSIYMSAVVALTGSGGWPMSVFLTPEGKPFYGGTYFPNTRRYQMPAFIDVLRGIANAWATQRDNIEHSAEELKRAIEQSGLPRVSESEPLTSRTLDLALNLLARSFDGAEGGWGGAPKFPQPMTLEFLLRRYRAKPDEFVRRMINLTLTKMARGGIYDQLGGGFHRYATDDIWLVPHFEKMLYDNAQLARVYLHAWQLFGDPLYRRIATETLDYVLREMTHPDGGFFSSQDADSEGEEGKFFVWTLDEIQSVLGGTTSGLLIVSKTRPEANDAQLFVDAYGVTAQGNFEGKNILYAARDVDVVAAMHQLSMEQAEARLANARAKLFAARERRVKPARDEKILASWNGLMLAAFAEAARVLKRDDYRAAAVRNAKFLLAALRGPDGRLKRSWKDGEARLNGYLEDYANLAEGLLVLYETSFDEEYFVAARDLADQILAHFSDPHGGFFDTSDDHETLLVRPKELQDNATPSGSAMAVMVLLKLAAYTGVGRYAEAAERTVAAMQPALAFASTAFAWWLCALDFALAQPREIAIIGNGDAQPLLEAALGDYRPNQVVAFKAPGQDSAVPLLAGRTLIDGRAAAYVCQNFACQMPVTEAQSLSAQLND